LERVEISRIFVTEDEIKEHFRLITSRPITRQTISASKCVARIAQWHIVEFLKAGLMPLRVGNYYLIKADVLEELFQMLDKNSIEHVLEKPNIASIKRGPGP
jgi:hypothetical protein